MGFSLIKGEQSPWRSENTEGEGTNSYVSNPNPRKSTSLNPKRYSMCSVFEVEPCVQIGRWSSFLPWDALCVSRMLATCRSNAAWILQCTLTAGNQAMMQKLTDHIRHTAQTKIMSYGWGPVTDTPKSLAMWLHATTQTTQHGEQCDAQGMSQSFTLQDRMFSSGWAHFFWPLIVDYEDTDTWKSPTLQWVTWEATLLFVQQHKHKFRYTLSPHVCIDNQPHCERYRSYLPIRYVWY